MRKIYLLICFVMMGVMSFAQSVSGSVQTEDGPAIGAIAKLQGTSLGAITDIDGNFTISNVAPGNYQLEISSVGYDKYITPISLSASQSLALGTVELTAGATALESVVVTGVIDLVRDRETPVAVSTITAEEIQYKIGNQEFPEIMKTTPSVYTTKNAGGYGDGRISVRGFDNTNVAVIINGQPVNDMENGRVYWSNWAGLQDMAYAIEIQRGLGASNLAVPSVGGTINVITKSTLADKGGYVVGTFGNDGYLKTTAGYNTGRVNKGWSLSAMVGKWQGNGYVDGTKGEGYNYLFGTGYKFSDKHSINLNFLGAGQWHHQRDTWVSIRDYQTFGNRDEAKDDIYRRFNLDWGELNGEEYNIRRNFYNKPLGSFNWDWDISSKTTLATSLYGSWGRGGGTGPRGRNFDVLPFNRDLTAHLGNSTLADKYRTPEGYIDYDAVFAKNESGTPYTGPISAFQGQIIGSNGYRNDGVNSGVMIRRSSVNSHNWYGAISNLRHEINDFTFGLGVDLRSYEGLHYRVLNDLMGLDGYYSTGNRYSNGQIITATSGAAPFENISTSPKIDYYNIGKVRWGGLNGLIEYNKERFNAVLQSGISNQSYQRIDYFDQLPHSSDTKSIQGGFVKGGANFRINDKHNIFGNAGVINRQPFFDAVFPNFANNVNEDVEPEKITSYEFGYGLRTDFLDANINLYHTTWTNRFLSQGVDVQVDPNTVVEGTAVYSGIENKHRGVELELRGHVTDKFNLNGMFSLGDWIYTGNTQADVFDDNQNKIGTSTLYIDGVKVGDVAQRTWNIGGDYELFRNFKIDATYMGYGELYSDFSVLDSEFANDNNDGALKLPDYGLLDAGLSFRTDLSKKIGLNLRLNVNNVLDELYIAESNSSIHDLNTGYSEYDGISNQNSVWFGFGRTWNFTTRLNFKGEPNKYKDSSSNVPVPAQPVVLDSDNDGVIDAADKCPNTPGTVSGCPDADGDGVVDSEDECVDIPGFASNNGCPDEIEIDATIVEVNPDSDGDGVVDAKDNCPDVAGSISNYGCPAPAVVAPIVTQPDVTVVERLNFIARSVFFKTASAQLENDSEAQLDAIADIMRQYPNTQFIVEGHTDSVGDANYNKDLSSKRAASVVSYLIKKGISASNLSSIGFGEEQPIASNDTPDGRQQNRRVVIRVR